jgi:hypothetical protein
VRAKIDLTVSRRRPRSRWTVLGVIAVTAMLYVVSSASAAPAPGWKMVVSSNPTSFSAGADPEGEGALAFEQFPQLAISATNVGAGPTSGTVTFTDVVPLGLTPMSAEARLRDSGGHGNAPVPFPCLTTGQTVSCVEGEPVPPGFQVEIAIPVAVASDAAPELEDEVTATGGGASEAQARTVTKVAAVPAGFGFLGGSAGLSAMASTEEGVPEVQAGAHPYELALDVGLPTEGDGFLHLRSAGHVKDLSVRLPKGMVVDPNATTEKCTEAELEAGGGEACPQGSQIGIIFTRTYANGVGAFESPAPLWNMDAPPGAPAQFAFDALGQEIFIHLTGGVRSDGSYELFADTNDILARSLNPIMGAKVLLWGDPTAEAHDPMRPCGTQTEDNCTLDRTEAPLLTMPTACTSGLSLFASADSWESPTIQVGRTGPVQGPLEETPGIFGCSQLGFSPTLSTDTGGATADSPTGLAVDLHVPQTKTAGELATANLKDVRVTLPPGLVLNPSAANGLASCTEAEAALKAEGPATCPNAAKIGTVEVDTPLLDHPLPGGVYVATPYANPFGSLLAIYIAVHDPESGVDVKLAGQVVANPSTGQLTASFDENPQLPFEDFKLNFFSGPRAALRTPAVCGRFDTQSAITPWSGTAAVASTSTFAVEAGAGGHPCAGSVAGLPNAPAFDAGLATPRAATFSPFLLDLAREDGTQEVGALDTTLPSGVLAKLAGVPYCPEGAIAAAAERSGSAELSSPSCPAASEVGTVTVGAGAGSRPYYVSGHAYLAGPYKGAPLSLVIITPAVAGPYDLGTVVVRAALAISPVTAQVTVRSDPIPHILKGIPLDIRSIAVAVSRPSFTTGPTSCDPTAVTGEAFSTLGVAAALTSRFQVGGCKELKFDPNLQIQLKGPTGRAKFPTLIAKVTAREGQANIRRASVTLPHAMFIEQSHIKTICTRVQFNAIPRECPEKSVYGYAEATSPLLDHALKGPVYLRSNGGERELPDVVAALQGPAEQPIEIDLLGYIDSVKGRLRTRFATVPDAPISKFVLRMKGGAKSLLVNSENLCRHPGKRKAVVQLTGQNSATKDFNPDVQVSCGRSRGHKAGKQISEGGSKR